MQKQSKIEFGKLLGFDSVSDRISGDVDFQDDTLGARLGAKVGLEPAEPSVTLPEREVK